MAEYIEKEALVHHFMTKRQYLTKDLVMDAAYEVSKFPAADVAAVVHGRWEKQHGIYSCSVCGKTCPYDVQADVIEYWTCNYCPNCGARMDGE